MKTAAKAATLLAAFLLAGCIGIGDTDDPCACPNLEATVASIDWLGDGTSPTGVITDTVTGERPLNARAEFRAVDDGPSGQALIAQRMIDAGFPLIDDSREQWQFQTDEWYVLVTRIRRLPDSSDTYPLVWVEIIDDDERAAEILAPISEALGTLP